MAIAFRCSSCSFSILLGSGTARARSLGVINFRTHNVFTRHLEVIDAAVGRTGELALPHTSNGIHGGVSNLRWDRRRTTKDTALFVDALPRGVGGCSVYTRRGATGHLTGETGQAREGAT